MSAVRLALERNARSDEKKHGEQHGDELDQQQVPHDESLRRLAARIALAERIGSDIFRGDELKRAELTRSGVFNRKVGTRAHRMRRADACPSR